MKIDDLEGFIMENPMKIDDLWRYPVLGSLHNPPYFRFPEQWTRNLDWREANGTVLFEVWSRQSCFHHVFTGFTEPKNKNKCWWFQPPKQTWLKHVEINNSSNQQPENDCRSWIYFILGSTRLSTLLHENTPAVFIINHQAFPG